MRDMSKKAHQETFGYLAERFSYDPQTGLLRWRYRPYFHFATAQAWRTFNTLHAGRPTSTNPAKSGHLTVRVDGVLLYVHRIAWILGTESKIPDGMLVDHRDQEPRNNELSNLRLASKSQNGFNAKKRERASGLPKGVYYDKRRGTYQAYITAGKKRIIKNVATLEEATALANLMREEKHGEFASRGKDAAP